MSRLGLHLLSRRLGGIVWSGVPLHVLGSEHDFRNLEEFRGILMSRRGLHILSRRLVICLALLLLMSRLGLHLLSRRLGGIVWSGVPLHVLGSEHDFRNLEELRGLFDLRLHHAARVGEAP